MVAYVVQLALAVVQCKPAGGGALAYAALGGDACIK
jgi:hypothetical protein